MHAEQKDRVDPAGAQEETRQQLEAAQAQQISLVKQFHDSQDENRALLEQVQISASACTCLLCFNHSLSSHAR